MFNQVFTHSALLMEITNLPLKWGRFQELRDETCWHGDLFCHVHVLVCYGLCGFCRCLWKEKFTQVRKEEATPNPPKQSLNIFYCLKLFYFIYSFNYSIIVSPQGIKHNLVFWLENTESFVLYSKYNGIKVFIPKWQMT